jgi:hypothetical protein
MRNAETLFHISLLIVCAPFPSLTRATELKPATAEAFQHYVQRTEERIHGDLDDPARFLYVDTLPEKQKAAALARLHDDHVVIEQMRTSDDGKEIKVPDGLVHHWLATGFIRGATRDQAIALAQDYPRHPQLYAPDVQKAEVRSHEGQHYSVYFRFYRKAIVTAVYNTEFSADYFLPDQLHGYCFARGMRIAEVENAGKANEKEYPVGNDHGYMWKLNLYTRFLERDNGVYIQIEFLALSRTVPAIFAWLVNPYVRSIPREYLTHYLDTTRKALMPEARGS